MNLKFRIRHLEVVSPLVGKNLAREAYKIFEGRQARRCGSEKIFCKRPQRQSGFTLIELAIYLGILTILLLILSSFFNSAMDTMLSSQATTPTEQDSKFIINRLFYDITNADSLTTPVSPGDSGQTMQLVKNGVTYTYAQTGNNFTLNDGSGTDVLNSPQTTISNLSFKRIGYNGESPTVQISFTIKSVATAKSGQDSQTFQTTVSLRGL